MANVSSIRPLPAEVLSQIRSSVIISSLNDVVLNLVKNSLDGNATIIEVTVDYARGSCIVEDDGLGIEPLEFSEAGGLGKMHHTSKLSPCATTHGGRGSFIALLSALSLVSITSHHHKHRSHNSISLHNSKVIARQIPTSSQHRISDKDHGTRVAVRDLFGSMPVRVKQRTSDVAANDKDWQNLKKCVVGLLLAWPSDVSTNVRNVLSSQNLKIRASQEPREHKDYICSILSQAMFITPSDKPHWVSATGSTSTLVISGTISTEPCPHKNVQFLTYHIYPMVDANGGNVLYDHINQIFANSSFGSEDENGILTERDRQKRSTDARYKQDGYTTKQLTGNKKGVSRWPMFCLKIESRDMDSSLGEEMADKFLDERKGQLASVMELLEQIVVGFLKQHNFRIRTRNVRSGRRTRISGSQSTKSSPEIKAVVPVRKRGSSLKRQVSTDLATDIKMPSFSREILSDAESPFNTWTRVKRGHVSKGQKGVGKFTVSNEDGISPDSDDLSIAKPRVSSPSIDMSKNRMSRQTEILAEATIATSMPLIASDGKVARPPFYIGGLDQREQGDAIAQNQSNVEPMDPPDHGRSSGGDLVSWINPASKEKSLICCRTGMAVTNKHSRLSQGSNVSRSYRPGMLASQSRQSLRTAGRASEEPSTWISGLLNSWDNPVFRPAELSIPQVSLDGLDTESQKILHGQHHNCTHANIDKAFRQSSGGLTGRLSKNALRNAEIVSQVDKKFILIKMVSTERENSSSIQMSDPNLLVLVDQHAADERCRVEDLLQELCENKVPVHLESPLSFDVSVQEILLFQGEITHFQNWGIVYETHDISEKNNRHTWVAVTGLPSVIVERCKLEPSILTTLLRTEVWKLYQSSLSGNVAKQQSNSSQLAVDWYTKLRDCPEGILDMLNSRSCRSAIMFNDELDIQQCKSLITRISKCAFPFQCAHGRPSMIPLVDMSVIFNNPSFDASK